MNASFSGKLVIASRESRLAMWQAEHVCARLLELYPHSTVEILGMTTRGDQILDRTLSKVGGKGLFVKELEVAMQNGEADLAVHSLKDVPMELPEGFELAWVEQGVHHPLLLGQVVSQPLRLVAHGKLQLLTGTEGQGHGLLAGAA